MTQQRCNGTNKAGEQCHGKALPGSAFCIAHDPQKIVAITEARRKGGAARSNRARARKRLPEGALSIPEVYAIMGQLLTELVAGTATPGVVNAAANAAKTIDQLNRGVELEEQIAALRRDLAAFADRKASG